MLLVMTVCCTRIPRCMRSASVVLHPGLSVGQLFVALIPVRVKLRSTSSMPLTSRPCLPQPKAGRLCVHAVMVKQQRHQAHQQQCQQHRRCAVMFRQELCGGGHKDRNDKPRKQPPDTGLRGRKGGDQGKARGVGRARGQGRPRAGSDYSAPVCGRMSSRLMPATTTGFFIASRRNGSPSS